MSFGLLSIITASFLLLFWIFPSVLATILLFCGRWDKELYLDKTYLLPHKRKMEAAIFCLEARASEQVTIISRDKTVLSGRWFNAGSDKSAILAHGFKASAISNCCMQAVAFLNRGYNVLLIDQRAHGKSGGKATCFGLKERYDILDWIKWLRVNKPCETLVAYGVSMGSAAIAYASPLIKNDEMQAMVLDCGFSSPYEQMNNIAREKHIPWALMSPIVRLCVKLFFNCDIKDSVTDSLQRTKIPAFIIHGGMDEVVHCEHGRKNYLACASSKDFAFIPEANHATAFILGGDELEDKLFDFIRKQCIQGA